MKKNNDKNQYVALSQNYWAPFRSTVQGRVPVGDYGEQPPKYIITTITCMASREYGNSQCGSWLEKARPLDASLVSTAPDVSKIVDGLFEDIFEQIENDSVLKHPRAKKTLARIKQTAKVILLNLYVAYLLGVPVRYSRDRNRYGLHKRYGKLFFKYSRVVACIKALRNLGLIHEKRGFNDRATHIGRQSRIWAGPQLISLFQQVEIHRPERVTLDTRKEPIELRDEAKNPIGYRDTERIRNFRANLKKYNAFMSQQNIMINLPRHHPITVNKLDKDLYAPCIQGRMSVIKVELDEEAITRIQNSKIIKKCTTTTGVTTPSSSITQTFFEIDSSISRLSEQKITATTTAGICPPATQTDIDLCDIRRDLAAEDQLFQQNSQMYSDPDDQLNQFNKCLPLLSFIIRKHRFWNRNEPEMNDTTVALDDFGIARLLFRINRTYLYRVFNNNSFELGGRFYGAFQSLPKEMRAGILFNNKPSVELDFGAHHIRIAYHLEQIDYREDPYLAMSDDRDERKIFKLLLLVLINAKTEAKAIAGFRDSIRKKKDCYIELTNENIGGLIRRVKEAHPRIADYFHSGAGLRFQFIDSQITEAILMRMTEQEIPCLPVHDSYIVPLQHKELLRKAMVEEYRQVMGFEPVVG